MIDYLNSESPTFVEDMVVLFDRWRELDRQVVGESGPRPAHSYRPPKLAGSICTLIIPWRMKAL